VQANAIWVSRTVGNSKDNITQSYIFNFGSRQTSYSTKKGSQGFRVLHKKDAELISSEGKVVISMRHGSQLAQHSLCNFQRCTHREHYTKGYCLMQVGEFTDMREGMLF